MEQIAAFIDWFTVGTRLEVLAKLGAALTALATAAWAVFKYLREAKPNPPPAPAPSISPSINQRADRGGVNVGRDAGSISTRGR